MPDNNPNPSNDNQIPDENRTDSQPRRISFDDWVTVYHINHDTFFQLAFALPEVAVAFLKNVLSPKTLECLDLDAMEIQPGILGESDYFKKSAADLIYVVPYKESAQQIHVSVILEHKSYSERMTTFQITKYCVHIMERELEQAEKDGQKLSQFRFSPVIPIIIHHGESAFYEATVLSDLIIPLPGSEELGINSKALLFDLNQIEVDKLEFGTNVPEFFSVLKMMQAIFSRRGAIEASEALTALRPYSKDVKYYNLIRALLIYLARCSKHVTREEYNQIIHDDTIVDQGEENMSSLVEQWIAEGEAKGFELGVEQGIVQGIERGIEQGIEQGIERGIEQGIERGIEQGIEQGVGQGVVKTLKDMILQTLSIRFGSVPQSVQDAVNDKCDAIVLKSLSQTALLAQSIDDFAKEL